MKRISCLMLDMGGVLTCEHNEAKVGELMAILGDGRGLGYSRDEFLRAYFALRPDYDRGVSNGAEYWRRVAAAVSPARSLSAAEIERLIAVDLESWFDNMRLPMLDFLGEARAKVERLVLLSNIHEDGVRHIREGAGRGWASQFHLLVLSCEHKLLKPEAAIYRLALEKAGVSPADTLFVDDNPENVEAALALGFSSFRFTDEKDFFTRLSRDYELAR